MKRHLLSVLSMALVMILSNNALAQQRASRMVTDPVKGTVIETTYSKPQTADCRMQPKGANILWEEHQEYSVAQHVYQVPAMPSKSEYNYLVNWSLNDRRISRYAESGNDLWDFPTDDNFTKLFSNTNGTLFAVADGTMLYVLDPVTGEPTWSFNAGGGVKHVCCSNDGYSLYVLVGDRDGQSYYECYTAGVDTPVWSVVAPTNPVIASLCEDDSKLVVCFGSSLKLAYVIDPATGATLQDNLYYYSNSPTQQPGMSANGEYLAFTDFSGKGTLYKWDGTQYVQQWSASLAGPGSSSTWGCGSCVSADGSTIAFGTLDFVTDGYDGCLYVFNNYSSEPIWTYTGMGDEVCYIDMTPDGSMIAVATWGPMNHSTPDFYAFLRNSNEPITTMTTSGAAEYLDLSNDGSRCIIGGKGVHPREYGYGGQLYLVDPRPENSGSLTGLVKLIGTDDNGNVTVSIEGLDSYHTTTNYEGEYTLSFIPAGTYQITASKPGYISQTQEVVIEADEVANLDFEMESCGSPVTTLYASQGASLDGISLTWTYNHDCVGFNIYRTSSATAPFTTPIAFVENEPHYMSYEDSDVTASVTYYYAVTAVLEGGLETPFSNIASGFASIANIPMEIDVFNGTVPTIDGIISEGEWDDAFVADVTNYLLPAPAGTVILRFKMNGDKLYVCSENHADTEWNDSEGVAFYIDDNNDGSYPEQGDDSEGNYWMYYVSTGNTVRYRPIYNTGGVGTTINLPEQIIACDMSEGYEVIEFALPFGSDEVWQINPNDNKCGFYLFVRDAATATMYGKWPATNEDTFNPAFYSTLNLNVEDVAPAAPTNVRIEEMYPVWHGLFAPIQWDAPLDNDISHYNVYVDGALFYEAVGTQMYFMGNENTTYSVYVTAVDYTGHESVASNTLEVHFGTYDVEEEDYPMVIYPNPASSVLNICSTLQGTATVRLMDITGRVVRTLNVDSLNKTQISVDGLTTGVYLLNISGNDFSVTRKLIVK